MSPELTIVTAASSHYGRCLWQFLRSAARHQLERQHRFVAYDLGLDAGQRGKIARDFPWCIWRSCPALPEHAAPARRTYAWKPIVIAAAVREFGGLLLWLDSATLFQGPLEEPLAGIRRHGLYTLAGQSMLQDRCDPEIWSIAGAPLEILHRPERAAGVIGLNPAHPEARAVIDRWCAWAEVPRFWHPLSGRHRPEQALLSILIYQAAAAGRLTLNDGDIDISCAQPVRWLSTRHKVSPFIPTAADPLVRAYYRAAKAIDRLGLRLRALKQSRIDGWHRWPQECYRVFVTSADRSNGPIEIKSPRSSYYADPFLCLHKDQTWVVLEEFRYPRNSGRLVAVPLNHPLEPGAPLPLDLPVRHLSFPFIFAHDGQWFLLPESHSQRSVDLYVCEAFPQRWRLARRLLVDVEAVDSTLLRHDNRWWLFTTERADGDGKRGLALYHTDNLLHGVWQRHQVSEERRYADRRFGYGRGAGPFVRTESGVLLRPIHASGRYYGEAVRWMQVDTLTTETFAESEYTGKAPQPAVVRAEQAHHLCVAGALAAWDIRTRTGWLSRTSAP